MCMPRIPTLALALTVPFLLAACSGGGAKVESQSDVRTTTTGQELLDLKSAYESGAISAEEYEDQRQKILDAE